jgi:hypothetical protein
MRPSFKQAIDLIRFLPFEPPSRKDPALIFVKGMIPYCVVGFLAIGLASYIVPSLKLFPTIWYSSLAALNDWFQISIHSLLTVVWLWTVSYSVGVLLIEASRRNYRDHVVRRIERLLKVRS